MADKDAPEEFQVRDRRRNEGDDAGSDAAAGTTGAPAAEQPAAHAEDAGLPDVDFPTFILSLATSAQISLGAVPHPETQKPEPHLPSAKQIIDVIGMLKEKTKGNLSKDEEGLLDQVLFSLRMHYVRVTEEQKKTGGA